MSVKKSAPKVIKKDDSLYGDSVLYYGLLAYLNRSKWESRLKDCQDSVTGRLMRNPDNQPAHTSRDMMIGFLLGCNQLEARKLRDYCKNNNWRLSPESPDYRNRVWFSGRVQLSMAAHQGWERFFSWTLPFTHFIETLTAWKAFQLHLVMVSLLFFEKHKKKSWFCRQAWSIIEMRSKNNPIKQFADGDIKGLKISFANVNHHSKSPYRDVWSPATFEFWRDVRMSHYAVQVWCTEAIFHLEEKQIANV